MSEFIKAIGIFYKNELNAIKKSGVQLQPVYEAFSNAWKSIEERFHGELMRHGRIRMEFHYTMGLFKNDAENRTATLDKIDKKKSCKSFDLQDSVRRERYLSQKEMSLIYLLFNELSTTYLAFPIKTVQIL